MPAIDPTLFPTDLPGARNRDITTRTPRRESLENEWDEGKRGELRFEIRRSFPSFRFAPGNESPHRPFEGAVAPHYDPTPPVSPAATATGLARACSSGRAKTADTAPRHSATIVITNAAS